MRSENLGVPFFTMIYFKSHQVRRASPEDWCGSTELRQTRARTYMAGVCLTTDVYMQLILDGSTFLEEEFD